MPRTQTKLKQQKQKKQKRLQPADRRRQLLTTAVDLFAEKGVGEAGHADIAQRVGVSTATSFVYFPTRQALMQAVFADVHRFFMEVFDGIDEGLDRAPHTGFGLASVQRILQRLAKRVLVLVDSHPAYVRVWLGWSARFDHDSRQAYLCFQNEILARLDAVLKDGFKAGPNGRPVLEKNREQSDQSDSRILLAACQALVVMKIDGESPKMLMRFTDRAIDTVLSKVSDKK